MQKAKKKPPRHMVAVPSPEQAREKIEIVRDDLSKRAGRVLTSGQAVLVAIQLAARLAGSGRSYILGEKQIVELLAKEVPVVVAGVVGALTGRTLEYSISTDGIVAFYFADATDAESRVIMGPPAVLAGLTEYELN